MKIALPSRFPQSSMPSEKLQVQCGAPAVSSVLSVLLVFFGVLPWGSVWAATPVESPAENADPSSSKSLWKSTLSSTGQRASTIETAFRSSHASTESLPSSMFMGSLPGQNDYSTASYSVEHPSNSSLIFASYFPRYNNQGAYGDSHDLENGRVVLEAAPGHYSKLIMQKVPPTATSLPFVGHPTGMLLPLRSSAGQVQQSSGNLPDGMLSMTLGKSSADTIHPKSSSNGYIWGTTAGTLHRLPPVNVSPAFCCRQEKYGLMSPKPWYCSLVCRLMARKIAQAEAARRKRREGSTESRNATSTGMSDGVLSDEYYRLTAAVLEAANRAPVVLFTKGHCRYCKEAIEFLRAFGVKKIYVVDLGQARDMHKLQVVLENLTGARTVPRIFIGGTCIGGLSDMTRENESGLLRKRLERASAL